MNDKDITKLFMREKAAKTKLHNLQILRGVSALLVFLFHSKCYFNGESSWGETLFSKGSIGVPIFFIISGFIMVHTTRKKQFNLQPVRHAWSFMAQRIIRVAPLYFTLTILIMLLYNGTTFINDGFFRLFKVFLFLPIGRFPPLYVGWTLNFEMFFYFLFSISLIFNNWRYLFLYFAIIFLVFAAPILSPGNEFAYPFFHLTTSPLLLHFLLGMMIGHLLPKISLSNKSTVILILSGFFAFLLYYFSPYRSLLGDFLFCGMLVFSTLLLDVSNLKFPKFRSLRYCGDISYSLYLVHPIVILVLPEVLQNLNLATNNLMVIFAFILIITFLFSAITYQLIERQFTNYLKVNLIKIRREDHREQEQIKKTEPVFSSLISVKFRKS